MAKLVDELLAYSKAGIKSTEIQTENINLRQLAEEVIEREKFAESDIKIEIDDDIKVQANRNFLSKALSNVLRNAVRYAGDKGEIILKADKEKENVTLKIIDSGEGVPESEIEPNFRTALPRRKRPCQTNRRQRFWFGNRQNLHRSLRRKSYG